MGQPGLFGFMNGGTGNHVLTYADGSALHVGSRDSAPTVISRGDGTEVATIHRAATSTAVRAGGGEVLRFGPDAEAETPDLFRLVVTDHAGQALPVPILGTRFWGHTTLTAEQRDILLAACVDITIGLRPYVEAMR